MGYRSVLWRGIAAVVLVLIAWRANVFQLPPESSYFFEVTLKTSVAGTVQLFFDPAGGRSVSLQNSRTLHATALNSSVPYRFQLPAGRYTFLRLDPIDRPALISFSRTRIVKTSLWGLIEQEYRLLPVSRFNAADQIAFISTRGNQAQLMVPEGAHDPILEFEFNAPMVLNRELLRQSTVRLLPAAVLLGLLLWSGASGANTGRRGAGAPVGRAIGIALALAWATAAWMLFFVWAAHVRSLGWNAIELVIGSNLTAYGQFSLGPLFPPALWRPVLAPVLLAAVERAVPDPVLVFRIFTASMSAILTLSMYWCGRRLGGEIYGSVAAALSIATPASSSLLLNHLHSISHFAMLGVLGPTVAISLALLVPREHWKPSSTRLVATGLMWGVCQLARPELALTAAPFLAACAWLAWRHRRWNVAVLPLAGFLLVFVPYQAWMSWEAARHNLLTNQKIYQFYASQGWSVPPPGPVRDGEADGFAYAVQLYGTPESNDFSIARAISRNPRAFEQRVSANATGVRTVLLGDAFFSPLVRGLLTLAPLAWALALLSGRDRRHMIPLWAAASFCSIGFVLGLHVDVRYLTIAVPFAIVLSVYAAHTFTLFVRHSERRAVLSMILVALALGVVPGAVRNVSAGLPDDGVNLDPIRDMAAQFMRITHPNRDERKQIYVGFDASSLRAPEDAFMFWYFTGTTMAAMGATPTDSYPRNRLFSYKACTATHLIVRRDAVSQFPGRALGDIHIEGFGDYTVVKVSDTAPVCVQ